MKMSLPEKKCARSREILLWIFPAELRTVSLWLIRLRWAIPPAIVAVAGAARGVNHPFPWRGLLMAAGWILCYNLVLWAWTFHLKWSDPKNHAGVQKFIYWQLGLDHLALLILIFLTGGIVSPLLYLCVFPILLTAGLLPPRFAYGSAALAVGVLAFMTLGKFYGFMDHPAVFGDVTPLVRPSLFPAGVYLFFFAVTLSVFTWLATSAMGLFRQQMTRRPDTRSDRQTVEASRFMMRAAHNLRAPLSAILTMLEVLRERHLGELNPDQAEYLRRVDRRVHTMLDMINELMHLSTTRSRLPLTRTPLDTAWLGGRLERTFQNGAAERKIDFTVIMENIPPPVSGDSGQIEQLLENLVSNAIKYTPEGGQVSVTFSSAPGNRVAIRVADSGIGIPEKDQSRLFTEFFRADNARKKQELGTGLGLAIVKEIVDAHQGFIQVESRENQGTAVLVTLPAAQTLGKERV